MLGQLIKIYLINNNKWDINNIVYIFDYIGDYTFTVNPLYFHDDCNRW